MTIGQHRLLIGALLAAGGIAAAATVHSQTAPLWDPFQLPETKGTVKQYTLTPRGDVDGLILADGTEVKLPPHLSTQVVFAVRPGDAVTIHGLKARAAALVDAQSIANDATGATVIDNGPGGPGRWGSETSVTGKITAALHGKRGEVNGALLENGTTLRLPPPEAARLSDLLQPGQAVTVRGSSTSSALGTVMEVRALGRTPDQLTEVVGPRGGPRGPKGGPDDRGPPPRG